MKINTINVLKGLGASFIILISLVTAFQTFSNSGLTASLFGSSTFVVTNTLDDGSVGSLRWAINQANADPDFSTIEFEIGSGEPSTIQLSGGLPPINFPIMVDGWSQSGEGIVGVEIRGNNSSDKVFTLNGAQNSTIRGLAINNSKSTCLRADGYNNQIYGNYIGLGLDGETVFPCYFRGIYSQIAYAGLKIGGEGNKRNVIAGSGDSISVYNGGNVEIRNNVIGMTASGKRVDGNYLGGIELLAVRGGVIANNFIGNADGTVSGGNNACVFNGGICLGTNVYDLTIDGNFIGVGLDGVIAHPNRNGITISPSDKNILIKNNVIAAYREKGIFVAGYYHNNGGSTDVSIQNNIIGLSKQGGQTIGGSIQTTGIRVEGVDGGVVIGPGNTISNNIDGIAVQSSYSVKINGNTIGLGLDKKTPYPNKGYGIHMAEVYSSPIKDNIIAFNESSGVGVSTRSDIISILNNSIFKNGSLGIDLIPNGGVTQNDTGDTDNGTNDLMNFPVLHKADFDFATGKLKILLTVDTPVGKKVLVQFFGNKELDPTTYGEGESFIYEKEMYPSSSKIEIPFSGNANYLTATATVDGKTSEFSKGLKINKPILDEGLDKTLTPPGPTNGGQ